MIINRRRGKTTPIYNIDQAKFKRNTQNCWFASAIINWSNNIVQRQVSLKEMRDIEQKAYDNFPMSRGALTLVAGLKRVSQVVQRTFTTFAFNSPQMHDALDKGLCVCVAITITQDFVRQRDDDQPIGDCKGIQEGGHIINLYKKD